ncbi:MFS transporter [Alkalihalobacillus oceani]|uniref:MFS transporter n=1 Tax=Halalkalibacter oceani TaxID=1653776 RepID=A0A9X2DLD5_9BACI|nr:MFS transporter [Halalkalibacter oceani]MCM3712871.1 MFS transporter [Halalkalibacter oceani]
MNERQPVYLIVFIGLLPFIMVIGNSMFIPLLPMMQTDLMITTFQGGMLLTSFSIPAALFVPLGGVLSDRYGRKQVALTALPFIMGGALLASVATSSALTSFALLLVARVLQGIGAGSITPLAMALVSDLYQGQQRNQAFGLIEVFNGAGKVVSPIIGALLLLYSWSLSFVVLFAFALLAFVGIAFFLPGKKNQARGQEAIWVKFRRLRSLFQREWRWLLPIFTAGAFGMFMLFGFLFYLSFRLEEQQWASPIWAGLFLAIPLLALTLSSYTTGKKLHGREDSYKRGMLSGAALMILSIFGMIFSTELSVVLAGLLLFGAGFGIVLPSANAALASIVSEQERGTVFAFYAMLRFLGVAFGPVLYAQWVADVEQMMYTSFFCVTLVGLLFMSSWSCLPIGKSCRPFPLS